MRIAITLLVACTLTLGAAGRATAKCGDNPGDDAAVAAARDAVAASCDCNAPTHGAYVSCAAGIANERALAGVLPMNCKGQVKRCAARSTCGKPGFVTCCRTTVTGKTKCSTKRSADKCVAPAGGTACVGQFSSCCDACSDGGCVSSPSGAFLGNSGAALF